MTALLHDRTVLILGCGFTGQRVAWRALQAGASVVATTRSPERLDKLAAAGATVLALDVNDPAQLDRLKRELPDNLLALHSIPLVSQAGQLSDPTPAVLNALGSRIARLVYLSTTGVYGATTDVDERTPAAPQTERQRLRYDAEQTVGAQSWPALVLRPAAIYGPGQGVQVSLPQGRYKLVGDGSNLVSRIHVDDLAQHCLAALSSDLTGAYPVADDEPAPAGEVATFVADLLGLPLPPSVGRDEVDETLRSDRRVNGRAVRAALDVTLIYPSYRVGIPAALAAEQTS